MTMPLELWVYPQEMEERKADEYVIRLLMENNSRGTIYIYPRETQLFEDIADALGQLELVGDLSIYERIYDSLGILSYDGRQLWMHLQLYCEMRGVTLDEMRYRQMERYRTYPYMKKKWKTYLKTQGKKVPSWEDVYGRFWSFLSPPWQAAQSGMIYLGTWIPDLGRYLD
jgi:hypothetical protein